ncbi:IS66 family insertion sequence element accessory protein TnpB [Ruminiclostridium cellobioparum]|uniref:IS66 family insertion sequence element accessory protein TnpB n=1 Tax=Ruminiclostridium cellobioparum TaxID=29355 RepID=UPI0005941891
MFNGAGVFDQIYISCGYTDLRCGIDGLAAIVQNEFKLNPFQNTIFLICGRKTNRIKAILWEGDGFVLLYKRLERGRFQWPRSEKEARLLRQIGQMICFVTVSSPLLWRPPS